MKIIKLFIIIGTLIAFSCNSNIKEKSKLDSTEVLALNVSKIKETAMSLEVSEGFPRNIPGIKKEWDLVNAKDWCSGFWPGILWYAYEYSGDEYIKVQAEKFTLPLKDIAYSSARNHDIGFIVYTSYGNGYRLTGNKEYKNVLLSAADTLATLYNPKVGSILSWPTQKQFRHNTIIDNMMNLELLFWASKNGGEKRLYDIAESHAEVSMKNIVRKDGSAFHLASFDENTGEFIAGKTHQGYADDSMWARGQTWGIYGFAMAHRETGRKDFLDTSIKLANHFLERLPEDGIPYWDFDDPDIPNSPKDASAAAIAACGLLELSSLTKDKGLQEKYVASANKFIHTLSSEKYLSGDTNQALLLHSTGHYPNNSEIDMPIIYADYYYMEALMRLKKLNDTNTNVLTSLK